MSTVAAKKRYLPEDLLTMPGGERYELVEGNLVERAVSIWSSYVAGVIFGLLQTFCRANRLGWVLPEGTSYQSFLRHPGKVRKPDVSFIRLSRLSLQQATAEGHVPLAPDLAVEVVSPNDLYYQVDEKIEEWLEAGVSLVWVVNPSTRTVRVYRPDGSETLLRENDELSGEAVVPGFRCLVQDFFVPPAGAEQPG